jgi:hypothetical protein
MWSTPETDQRISCSWMPWPKCTCWVRPAVTPAYAGLYGVANVPHFIQKFDNTLTTSLYSTAFGRPHRAVSVALLLSWLMTASGFTSGGWGGIATHVGNTQGLPLPPTHPSAPPTALTSTCTVQARRQTAMNMLLLCENGGGEHVGRRTIPL